MCLTGKASLRKYLADLTPQQKAIVRNELNAVVGGILRVEKIVLKGHKTRHSLMVTEKPVSLWQQVKELKEMFEPNQLVQ